MFENLKEQPADKILALMQAYREDDREQKIDLGVGVYKDASGNTPIMRAIKAAEKQLWEVEETKAYTGLAGDPAYGDAMVNLVLGDAVPRTNVAAAATPGGTGAVRLAVALSKAAGVQRVYLGTPSWPNHAQILEDVGVETGTFRHAAPDGTADIDALLDVIANARASDAVLLHGCCHNPTGVDYTPEQWDRIADALADSGVLPILDVAYHGLGLGLEEDVAGVRKVLAKVPEALVAYSCDKNFGLYRDRVGAFYMIAKSADDLPAITSNANALARANWSMPPDHGGAAVRTVLRDDALTATWLDELAEMRERMRRVRERLAAADNDVPGLNLATLAHQNGLFAVLPLSKDQIVSLREDHGIYMAGSGRINVAGLHEGNTAKFIAALADVTGN